MYDAARIASLHAALHRALPLWPVDPASDLALLTVSENATFMLTDAGSGRRLVVRVHRPGYHETVEIASELDWILALRRDGAVRTPAPIAGRDGALIQTVGVAGTPLHAVAFEHVRGAEPAADALPAWFRELGAVTARMHRHARTWARPAGFTRKLWNVHTALGERPHWGPWRAGIGLDAPGTALLERAVIGITGRLDRFGTAAARFGVVHADLRLANLLVDGDALHVIDFDDCGLSWFMYDFAAAISFIEHEPYIPTLLDSWLAGYRSVAPLDAEDEDAIPALVMLRRILLMAWIASHRETPTAQAAGASFTADTLRLAEVFLARR